ncbi:hypothetical protein Pint_36440 [Pistacia integerrima]|uniref:Uncharacterized protein n=1 Tax=Pistacia integerrima TaxID=434235 RepID=A0ACC0Y3J8_9ROSI|nr:hypothetical protein Pint_36440 [Pistacia integerrima]
MKSGRKAVESVKESAANTAASAKGMEKARATAKEKAEKMTTRDPEDKEAATLEKEMGNSDAELNTDAAKVHNEVARSLAEFGGPRPGYKTRGTEPPETTTATEDYVDDYTTPTTDPRYHPRPTSGGAYR